MAKCRQCGAEITFNPHPQNPERMAPYDADGKLHFATCRAKKDDQRRYDSIDQIEQRATCGSETAFVHYFKNANGMIVLRASCNCGRLHSATILPMNEENKALINMFPMKASASPPYFTRFSTVLDPFSTVEEVKAYNQAANAGAT